MQITIIPHIPQGYSTYKQLVLKGYYHKKIAAFLSREAHIMRGIVIKGFTAQGITSQWKPLSPWTLALRKLKNFTGTKALIHTGEMRKSVVALSNPSKLESFCGILYQTRRPDGSLMINLAKVHEFGKTIFIPVTLKMLRFLHYVARTAGLTGGSSTGGGGLSVGTILIIVIPPRPFMFPAKEEWMVGVKSRIQRTFKTGL